MFFLLLTDQIVLGSDGKETKTFLIKDLFEVFSGIVEDNHLPILEGTQDEITFLRINSLKDQKFKYKRFELVESNRSKDSLLESTKQDSTQKSAVKKSKILNKADYLIYTRGIPKGFSMLNNSISESKNLVASHQFICLRPKMELIDVYLPYLHLVLDVFVEKKLDQIFKEKEEIKGNKYGAFNSITIKELGKMELAILNSVDSQKKVFEQYNKIKEEVEVALTRLEFIKESINNNYYI
jgi:hypothetical protein